MGLRKDGTHAFGVVRPAESDVERAHADENGLIMEVIPAMGYTHFEAEDGTGLMLVLTGGDGAMVRAFRPGEWADVLINLPDDVVEEEEEEEA